MEAGHRADLLDLDAHVMRALAQHPQLETFGALPVDRGAVAHVGDRHDVAATAVHDTETRDECVAQQFVDRGVVELTQHGHCRSPLGAQRRDAG